VEEKHMVRLAPCQKELERVGGWRMKGWEITLLGTSFGVRLDLADSGPPVMKRSVQLLTMSMGRLNHDSRDNDLA